MGMRRSLSWPSEQIHRSYLQVSELWGKHIYIEWEAWVFDHQSILKLSQSPSLRYSRSYIYIHLYAFIYICDLCVYIYVYRYTYMILHPVSGIDPTTAIRKSRMAPRHERTPNGRWDSPPRSRRRLTDTPALGHSVCSSRCSLLVGKSTLDMWEIHGNPRVVDGFPKETWVFHIYMFWLVVYLPLWKI